MTEKIVLQKKSELVAVNPGSIGLSAGGRMRWESRAQSNLPPSPFVGMLSEIEMELGITRDEIDDIRLISICRELHWGGKPTAFFVAKTELTLEEVESGLKCQDCSRIWSYRDGIYDFRTPLES